MSKTEPTSSSVQHGIVASSLPSSVRCTFLGSLSSRRGRDILSQLCLQIAQRSNLRHHFVERKDMDKINRQFFDKSMKKAVNRSRLVTLQQQQSPYDQSQPFEMKVFYVRDQLERISNEQVHQHFIFVDYKTIPRFSFFLSIRKSMTICHAI